MKNSITIRQTSSTTPVSSMFNHSTSRIGQTEVFEDYSQVRVYYIQGFLFLSQLRSNSRLSLLLLSWHFFLS